MITMNEMYKYIFKRKNIPERLYSMNKILDTYGYGQYAGIACNRIANANLLDGEHVQIDFIEFPNILVDYHGVIKCEDILLGYIDIKDLSTLEEAMVSNHSLIKLYNNMMEYLRGMSVKDILGIIKQTIKSESKDVIEMKWKIIKICVLEITARSMLNKIVQKIYYLYLKCYCKIKYKDIFSALHVIQSTKDSDEILR